MSSGRRKLLLADDSPTIQKVISLTFGDDEGFEVVAVGDGEQALRALADDPPPDVVLADAVMPGPDGYELCERIKRDARLRHIPVILLVGTFEPFNEAEARRVGADTVLTKPFQSIRNLVGKVGSLLGGGEAKPDESADALRPQDGPTASHAPSRGDSPAHFDARGAEPDEESVGHRGNHQSRIAVTDQDDVVQTFVFDEIEHVVRVCIEIDLRAHEVFLVSEARQCERIDLVALRTQLIGDGPPRPTAEPKSRNQHEGRH